MSAAERGDRVPEIKRALSDVRQLCAALDLMKGAKRQANGLIVCCPSHGEKNASCSVTIADDGTIRVKCFSCGWGGDALHLIAAARNLNTGRDFKEVLDEAARIAGISDLEYVAPQREEPKRKAHDYPLLSEVASIWQRAVSVTDHTGAAAWLESRGLDPEQLARLDAVRALPAGISLPWWASYRGDAAESRPWTETGHVLLFPVYDATGQRRSVRAGRVVDGKDAPKRLPPAGHLASGLVLANKTALAVLGHGARYDVLIVEGEPDFLTWADAPGVAVFGVGSGWWTRAHAKRIPSGTRVVIRTHQDEAGDRYATEIGRTLVRRAQLFRPRPDGRGDENDRLRTKIRARTFDEAAEPFAVETVDPLTFYLGRRFAEHYWLGDELKPGVFAVRCPGEFLHQWGGRYDGSTVLKAPEREGERGTFRCSHASCRDKYGRVDVLDNSMRRISAAEGL